MDGPVLFLALESAVFGAGAGGTAEQGDGGLSAIPAEVVCHYRERKRGLRGMRWEIEGNQGVLALFRTSALRKSLILSLFLHGNSLNDTERRPSK